MAKNDEKQAEKKTWNEWAEAKGHVHKLQLASLTSPRRNPNRGIPDARVVRAYYGWPLGLLMSEADYDSAVEHVYHGAIYL